MKVLIMYSWDDDTSKRRWEWLSERSDLGHITVSQCFAVRSPAARMSAGSIFKRLSSAIRKHRPDVVLFHTGAAYHRSPASFAECAIRVRATYPEARLGFERRWAEDDALAKTGVFENTPEMLEIENLVFG